MNDLVTWLREQIAEDAAKARAATAGPWVKDTGSGYVHGGQDCRFVIAAQVPPWNSAHITRHDPRAVLAQCEAHTMLLDSITARLGDADRLEQMGAQPADVSVIRAPAEWQLAVTSLAYQHRPGYREEWKP